MSVWAPGIRLGPYELTAPLGAGGMGEVWKARDTRIDRVVAIKRLKAEHAERFEREARAIAALNHPHICQLYDVGPDYLVMEYIEGKPVTGPLPIPEALRVALKSPAPSMPRTVKESYTAISSRTISSSPGLARSNSSTS